MADMMWRIDATPETQRKPEDIISEQCGLLNETLKGIVRANIAPYEKPISEYLSAPLETVAIAAEYLSKPRNIQAILGETGESSTITYELYLSAKNIPKYQYRILFLQHGLSAYPARLYVEKQVIESTELKTTSISIANEEELIEKLSKILGSNRVTEIIRKMATYR